MAQSGFIKALIQRRVPHILGVYMAGLWLCVEIADWMGERFNIIPDFSAYVFIILLSMVPTVFFIAWAHGQPGKDEWTWKQTVFGVTNVVLALIIAVSFGGTTPSSSPLLSPLNQTINLKHATPQSGYLNLQETRQNLNQKVSLFFWTNEDNKTDNDWLSYGATWLLSKDLKRTPYVSVETPFDSDAMRFALQDRGYENAVGEPLPLARQIAENRSSQWLIRGQFSHQDNGFIFEASLYNVLTGHLVKTISHQTNNMLLALDYISAELLSLILADNKEESNKIPQLAIQDHISTNIQAIQYLINSLWIEAFENDFPQAIESLKLAIEADPYLAEAYVLQMRMYRDMGQFENARFMAQKALEYDFKLYSEDVFLVTANLYALDGEEDKAIKVLENWVKEYPNSAEALYLLGNNLIVKGHRLDDAEAVFKQLKHIEPHNKNLLRLSQVYILKEQFDLAEESIRAFLSYHPNHKAGLLSLGDVLQRQGNYQGAVAVFEQAVLTNHNDIEAAVQFALNQGLSDNPEEAISQLIALNQHAKNSQQRFAISLALEQMYMQKGQIQHVLDTLEAAKEDSRKTQSYISHIMNYHGKRITYLTLLGQTDQAREELNKLKESTEDPFNKMLVFIELAYYDFLNDAENISKNLDISRRVITEFKASIYQQFIDNYAAILYRLNQQFKQAITAHNKAIKESKQSFIALKDRRIIEEFIYEKADTHYLAGEYQQALELIDDVLVARPRFAEILLLKLKILNAQKEYAQANQVITLLDSYWQDADPDYSQYKIFLAEKKSLNLNVSALTAQ